MFIRSKVMNDLSLVEARNLSRLHETTQHNFNVENYFKMAQECKVKKKTCKFQSPLTLGGQESFQVVKFNK